MAQRYALGSPDSRAYLAHPVLGPRLNAAAAALLGHAGRPVLGLLGPPDHLKLRSSATLFAAVAPPGSVFHRLLDAFFDGAPDPRTLAALGPDASAALGPDLPHGPDVPAKPGA